MAMQRDGVAFAIARSAVLLAKIAKIAKTYWIHGGYMLFLGTDQIARFEPYSSCPLPLTLPSPLPSPKKLNSTTKTTKITKITTFLFFPRPVRPTRSG